MSWKGTLKHLDLGPGQWVLETTDGQRMPLYGEVPEALDGRKVVVSGDEVEQMGFAMTGGASGIQVSKVRAQ